MTVLTFRRRSPAASDTVIAKDTGVQGRIIGQAPGCIRVEGRLVGGIETTGPAEVTETGEIAGDIRAGDVTVAGTVYGNVIATGKLTLHPTARVLGDFIRTRELKIAQGALFQGKCEIEDSQGQVPAVPAAAASPATPRAAEAAGATAAAPAGRGGVLPDSAPAPAAVGSRDGRVPAAAAGAAVSAAPAGAPVASTLGSALRGAALVSGSLGQGRPVPLEIPPRGRLPFARPPLSHDGGPGPGVTEVPGKPPAEGEDAAEEVPPSSPPPAPFPLLPRARERDPRAGGGL